MSRREKGTAWLRAHGGWMLLGMGVAFVIIGLLRKEHLMILEKAIRICLECIGIG
ncbi:MAG: hypothetical protein IJ189_08910 [Clostridia bacterium]|nr:hypothetical protein [Clostridia bacterium]